MRLENPSIQPSVLLGTQKMDIAQSDKFQQILREQAARRSQDTITIYSQTPASGKNVNTEAASAPPALTILPTDSTEIKLAKLQQIAENSDYTGRSAKDIYKTIWDRYNAAFDGNMAAIDTFNGLGGEGWYAIHEQFYQEANREVFNPIRREAKQAAGLRPGEEVSGNQLTPTFRKIRAYALGYSGSCEEIEASILKRYEGKDTFGDFLNMQGELFATGVWDEKMGFDGSFQYYGFLGTQIQRTYNAEAYMTGGAPMSQSKFKSLLPTKFDASSFFSDMKSQLEKMTYHNFNFDVQEVLSTAIDDFMAQLEHGRKE